MQNAGGIYVAGGTSHITARNQRHEARDSGASLLWETEDIIITDTVVTATSLLNMTLVESGLSMRKQSASSVALSAITRLNVMVVDFFSLM